MKRAQRRYLIPMLQKYSLQENVVQRYLTVFLKFSGEAHFAQIGEKNFSWESSRGWGGGGGWGGWSHYGTEHERRLVSFIYFIVESKICLLSVEHELDAHISTIPVDYLDSPSCFVAKYQ